MTAAEPPRLRLRPGVAVTPLRNGLHLRGRDGSVTLEGSKALPALWKLLSEQFGRGPEDLLGEEEYVDPESGGLRLDPADPRVVAALAALTAQLQAHDLLAEYPPGAAEPAAWLGACAPRPARAAAALAATRPVVAAADPDGPLATALISALHRAGSPPQVYRDTGLPADRVVAVAGTPAVAVAVTRTSDGGFVTAPAEPERVRTDAESIAVRLGADTGSAPADAAAATPAALTALTALLAGAAAQRLLCAAASLPDPAAREKDLQLLPDRPAVLVAVARPPHASYRPWVSGPADPASLSPAPVGSLAEALRRVGALGDPYLGVLDAPRPGGLPQLPAALAACTSVAGPLVAGAPRTDLARLSAACRAAELHLDEVMPGPVTVGAGPGHALGRALRRAALAAAGPPDLALGEEEWREQPQARHWWTVLTRHLGLAMQMTVHQFSVGGAYLAVVRNLAARGGTAGVAARAVEATPADAAALAALGAVTRAMAAEHGPAGAVHTAFTGAEAPLAVAGVEPAAWTDDGWTDRWLAGIAHREPELCAALARLTGLRPEPWQPGEADLADLAGPAAGGPAGSAGPVLAALRACGFTVLAEWGGAR
ncbi:hypothetical protein [Streptomyces sp. KS 21]|uniref:hypothetical protein n=1 Tax=Streptomyces sp. KS 21 TaxID=2485150 RepID=UPI0010630BE1|nr:hypothetical protein [Streptomyces sp. KS 21]TDU73968.1 hypothetical protein EDD91_0594 [Streptomyces sp. KS 21]